MYGYPESSHRVIETKEQKSLDFKASSCFRIASRYVTQSYSSQVLHTAFVSMCYLLDMHLSRPAR